MSCTPGEYFIIKQVAEEQKRYVNSSTDRVSYSMEKGLKHKVKVPPRHLIDKFNRYCQPLFEIQKMNEQIIHKLERLQKCGIESLD